MAIGDDWTIDYNVKRIYHSSGTTIYTVRNLYTYLQDTFDELDQMDDDVPMSAQTPTEFTMINGWFIDDESLKYLKGGAIATSGWTNIIHIVSYTGSFTGTDVGKVVQDDSVSVGPLLYYDNTLGVCYIREDRGSYTQIASGSDLDVLTGTQDLTAAANGSTGESLYANIYTLGTIATDPPAQVYVFQAGSAIAEWSTLDNWDPYGSGLGHIDVLIKVKEYDTEIDSAIITVYSRQFGDNYDHFEIDLTNGGRNAVPLATSTDLNNTSHEMYLFYDNEDTAPSVGDIVEGGTTGHRAEVIGITDWGTDGLLKLGNVTGLFQDDEDLLVASPLATVGSVLGQAGEQYILYDNESGGPFTLGEHLTGSLTHVASLHGLVDRGASGYMILGSANAIFAANEHITGAVSGAVASVFAAGEPGILQYGLSPKITVRLVNATLAYKSQANNFVEGRVVTGTTSKAYGVVLEDNDSGTSGWLIIGNMASGPFSNGEVLYQGATICATVDSAGPMTASHTMGKAFTQQSEYPYDVIINCAGMTLATVYEYLKSTTREDSTYSVYTASPAAASLIQRLDGEEYQRAWVSYALSKTAPFGTFAGGVFFGARGVWVENMDSGDTQNYQLTDAGGNTRTPPNFQALTITAASPGDRVSIFRTTGDNYTINKALYSVEARGGNVATVSIDTVIATDTPSAGYIRVVDVDSSNIEYRHRYTAWTGTAFQLATNIATALVASDTAYVPYVDVEASQTSVSQTVIYASDRFVMARVRLKGIIPFETKGQLKSTGYTTAAIRTTDAIVE